MLFSRLAGNSEFDAPFRASGVALRSRSIEVRAAFLCALDTSLFLQFWRLAVERALVHGSSYSGACSEQHWIV